MIDLRTPRLIAGLAAGIGCIALAFQSVAASAAPIAHAQESGQEDADQEEAVQEEEEHGPLHESMETIQGGMKSLRKMLTKPEQKAEAIELCRKMQAATLVGFQNPPEPLEALEGTALLEHSADFRKRMLEVCGTLIDLEVAFEKEDGDATRALYRALGALKKDGHDSYL